MKQTLNEYKESYFSVMQHYPSPTRIERFMQSPDYIPDVVEETKEEAVELQQPLEIAKFLEVPESELIQIPAVIEKVDEAIQAVEVIEDEGYTIQDFEELESFVTSGNVTVKKASFEITDDYKANWAVKVYGQEMANIDRQIDVCMVEVLRYQEKIRIYEERKKSTAAWMRTQLVKYFNSKEKDIKGTKTQKVYSLPDGKLVLKLAKTEFVKDEEKLLSHIKTNDLKYLKSKTVESVDWASYKKILEIKENRVINKDTGEILDCIRVEETPPIFEIVT